MDDIDLANEHNQNFQDAILAMRPRPKPIPEGPGLCLYCLDICPDRRRWCNAECRDAWEKERS